MKRVVAKLLLEQIGTCLAFSTLDGAIATFAFKDFPMIAPDGSFTSADLFEVKVDVEACEMTSAALDGDSLTERDTLTPLAPLRRHRPATPVESCRSLSKRCPWGRLGSVL